MSPKRVSPHRSPALRPEGPGTPGQTQPAAQESNPALAFCCTAGLLVLLLLPLFGGGYSGSGFQLAFVLLPLALCAGLSASRSLPRPALYVLLAYLLGLVLLPFWLAPGQLLWYYLAQIPLGWCWAWILLSDSPARARWLIPVAAGGALLTAVYGLFLWYGSGTLGYQLTSSFGLHNPYGGYLLLSWPCALLAGLQAANKLARWAWFAGALLLVAALVLTHSQGSIAAFGLQLVLLVLWSAAAVLRRRRTAKAGPAGGRYGLVGLLAGLAIVLIGLLLLPPVRETLAQTFDFGGYSMQGRLRFWTAALQIFSDHLAGAGPGSFAYVYPQYQKDWIYYSVDPHSWELQLLAELGLFGLGLLLLIAAGMWLWLRRLYQSQCPPLLAALCAAAVIGSLAHATIDFDYTFSSITLLLGIMLAYGSFIAGRSGAAGERSAGTAAAQSAANEPAPSTALPAGNTGAGKMAPWPAMACMLLLLICAFWGERLSLERFVLDELRGLRVGEMLQGQSGGAASIALRREQLLRSAIRYNPGNHQTRYQLAYQLAVSPSAKQREEAVALAESAVKINPRYPQAWALIGLLAKDPERRDEAFEQAIKLDPYNFPEHYYYWANRVEDEDQRREILLLGMQRIPAHDPIPPDHPRPQWHELNPVFGTWWEELARLTEDAQEKKLYEQRAARFREYVISEREKTLRQGS